MLMRLLFVALMLLASVAQAAVYSLPWGPKPQFVDANGAPMSSGTLQFYVAGSTTPQNTYTDSTGGTPNSNPITLNTRGESPSEIWLTGGVIYKMVLKDSTGSTVWTVDNIRGINDSSAVLTVDEWLAGPTPTYVSATSFTLAGDQTTTFTVGRRVKTTNSGGTIYSTIATSVFGAVTTVTVTNDTGSIDSGLSAVSYGVLRSQNGSIPNVKLDASGNWTFQGTVTLPTGTNITNPIYTTQTLTDAATIAWNASSGQVGTVTLGGNRTMAAPTNLKTGGHYVLVVTQDGTGSRTLAFNSVFKGYSGLTPQQPATGIADVTTYVFESPDGTNLRQTGPPPVPRGWIDGLVLSTAGSSATFTVAAGQATDSGNNVLIPLTSSLAKTTSSWAVGAASGCLDTGAIATSTWYHVYIIERPDTGVSDILCSTSVSAPTMPASYIYKRRIGSMKTNGSSQWTLFTQDGDYFRWSASILDVGTTNPGASAVTSTLTVPTGVNVMSFGQLLITDSAQANGINLSDLAAADETPSNTLAPTNTAMFPGAGGFSSVPWQVRTNTSAQIRYKVQVSGANTIVRIATLGWIDQRGKNQ